MIRELHTILVDEVLSRIDRDRYVSILETGTIRGDTKASATGDGWSTVTFAHAVRDRGGGRVLSIDLDVSVAERVLRERQLDHCVDLRQEHSIRALAREVAFGRKYDIVFLDSDNDPQLILHELLLAQWLVKVPGVIVIDDVRMPHHVSGEAALAKKGDLVLPYLSQNEIGYSLHERSGWNGYVTGVLVIGVEV